MIIREYEYEKDRPWNCQERFVRIGGEDAWNRYLNELNNPLSLIYMNMHTELINQDHEAIAFRFLMGDKTFVHVAQEWTELLTRKPIIVNI